MIFKSRQVNLDPEPWACYAIVTRDGGKTFERAEVRRHAEEHEGDVHYEPRSEQFDTPVNPLLAEFRLLWAGQTDMQDMAAEMVYNLTDHDYLWEMQRDTDYTPDQVNHAVKVLERLAAL